MVEYPDTLDAISISVNTNYACVDIPRTGWHYTTSLTSSHWIVEQYVVFHASADTLLIIFRVRQLSFILDTKRFGVKGSEFGSAHGEAFEA